MEVGADYVKLATIAVLHSPVKLSPASKLGIHFLLPAPFYILSLFLFAFFFFFFFFWGGGGGASLPSYHFLKATKGSCLQRVKRLKKLLLISQQPQEI